VTLVFAASVRNEIADFVAAAVTVYSLLIIAWIVVQLVLSLGARIPYARWSSAIISFLSEVSEPYLRIFRRLGLQIGPLDLSPMVAIILLQIVGGIVVGVIHG
jgi:uncharacterized protein YggT (Ycf19 family)